MTIRQATRMISVDADVAALPLGRVVVQAPSARRRPRLSISNHGRDLAILGGVLLLVVIVHASGLARSPGPIDDEGTYMAQAWAVQHGLGLAHYTYWYDHPPLGWILLAGWSWLTGPLHHATPSVIVGRQAMLLIHLVSCVVMYGWARRLRLNRAKAALVVGLWSLSPLALNYQRTVYLDNIAVLWTLLAFFLALSPSKRLWSHAAAGLCMAGAVLSKETFVLLLPALAYQLWTAGDRRTRPYGLALSGALFALATATFPLYALLKGELFPGRGHVSLLDAVRFQVGGRHGSGSVFDAASVAHRTVSGWLHLDPWLLGGGLLGAVFALLIRKWRPVGLGLLLQGVMILRPGYLPVPFLIGLLPFCALAMVGGADEFGRALLRALQTDRWHLDRVVAAMSARSGWTKTVVAAGAAGGITLGLLAPVAMAAEPRWSAGDRSIMQSSWFRPVRQAEEWLATNVDHRSRLLVDDTLWVDLVQAGFRRKFGVVWIYKLDFTNNLDPSVFRALPRGWQEFDYVVSTPSLRASLLNPTGLQQVRSAIDHSEVVATFGSGAAEVDVRHVVQRVQTSGANRPARGAIHGQ